MQKTILLLSAILFSNFMLAQTENSNAANWLNKNCIPIKYVKAENGLDDLKPLKDLIGDARIVSLGECTHGSSEVFSMKHRMLEYLVKEKGFTIFSIEANMPEAYALNEYIIDGKGDARKLMAGMYFWTWYTQEVLDMIEWMKKYNETAVKKIMFTGFDMQAPNVAIKIVRDYCLNNPALLQVVNDYDSLSTKKQMKKNESNDNFKTVKANAQILLDSLNAHKPAAYNKDFNWALQNARILWQYAANHFSKPARDESMAENVKWILDENPSAKIVLWAHNGHIRKDNDGFEYKSMGEYLDKLYGKQMIAIGFATAEGTYTAVQRDDKGKFIALDSTNNILPKENSYESIFNTADAANFILDVRNVSKDQEGSGWLFEKKFFRTIGAGAVNKFQFAKINLTSHFDMVIFIRKTSASKCFSIKKLVGN